MSLKERVKDNIIAVGASFISLIAIFSGIAQLDSYLAKQGDLIKLTYRVRLNEKERELSKVSTRYFELVSLNEKAPSSQLKLDIVDLRIDRKALKDEINEIKKEL